jgi:hypothetical protein
VQKAFGSMNTVFEVFHVLWCGVSAPIGGLVVGTF